MPEDIYYDVEVEVISQKGICHWGHKVGDKWLFGYQKSPGGLCLGAMAALLPGIRMLWGGGVFPTSLSGFPRGTNQLCCIDPRNPVVFELRRVPQQKKPEA